MSRMIAIGIAVLLAVSARAGARAQDTFDPPVTSQYRGGPQRPGTIDAEPFRALPTLAWHVPLPRPIRMTPVVFDETVYIGSEAGTLLALDRATGTERWRFDAGAALVSTPAVTAERLYVGALNGQVYALKGNKTAEFWMYTPGATGLPLTAG